MPLDADGTLGERRGMRFLPILVVALAGTLSLAIQGISPPRELRTERPLPGSLADQRFRRGDDPTWSKPGYRDDSWESGRGRFLPSRDGVYWVRWRVRVADNPESLRRDGLVVKVVASYELYWDGRLLGASGRVGRSAAEEVPGHVDSLFQIPPDLLTPGEHVVALRMSSFHTGFPGPGYQLWIGWGEFRALLVERARTATFSVMAVGAAAVVSLAFGLLWLLAARRVPVLLFSLLFLCVALMQALQASRWLYDYPYDWHYPRLLAITVLVTGMAVLLPAFVLHHFRVGRPLWGYGILAALLGFAWYSSPVYHVIGLAAATAGFTSAQVLALWAAMARKRGALPAGIGLAVSVAALFRDPGNFLDDAFFFSAGPAVLGLLVALVLQLRDERNDAERARLTAARLELELLRKQLQPHFLVNTLATIQEVIDSDPPAASGMVEALAAEFRLLARISGERLIPLGQELELCRAHLAVMSRRKGARAELQAVGTDDTARVPPALFHTLVENGLTHLLPRAGRLHFSLRADRLADGIRYTLVAHGIREEGRPANPPREGTGLRYVRARLDESFPGSWTLASVAVPEGWETMIEIRSPDAMPPSPCA
jgi:hypothetical protein